jgi:predicted membrane chloride channel (bestrophin family)
MTSSSSSPFDYSRTVHYKSSDHFSVIFQAYGSVWPKVLPHCAGTVAVTAAILAAERYYDHDLTISEWGHQFMSVIVAFLVVSRCTITFSLYYEFRGYVTQILAATRDFVQLTAAMTPVKAAGFRSDVTLQAMLLVRATAAMLRGQPAWESRSDEQPSLRHIISHGSGSNPAEYGMILVEEDESARWIHRRHTSADKNLAIPLRLVYKLRETVVKNRRELNLDTIQEQQLLACLQDFLRGYDGLRKYLTTPFPFPLGSYWP